MKPTMRKWNRAASPSRQRGMTLAMALIMLVLLTVMAVTAFHLGTSQTIVVSNAQHRDEATDAAQQTIETVLNSANFMTNPDTAIATSNCTGGGANSWCVDVNGDGAADVKVSLSPKPTCVAGVPIANSALDFANAQDLACSTGAAQTFGVEGSTNTNSLCSNSNWEITAAANDAVTNSKVTLVQGVSARIATTALDNNCP